MRADALREAESRAATVNQMIMLGEAIRALISDQGGEYVNLRENAIVQSLMRVTPDEGALKIHEHCATVTRLYSIFESFISQIVRAWLAVFPHISGPYDNLPEKFKKVHRLGIAKVLMDLDKDRFYDLPTQTVLEGYWNGLTQQATYSILPEAFLSQTRSLRRDRLEELFGQIGLEGGWDWIARSYHVTNFLAQERGGENTAEAELRAFINYRNEAAHGSVNEVLGVGPLTEYVKFIIAIIRAIDELFQWNWVRCSVKTRQISKIGEITHLYKDNVAIASLSDCRVRRNIQCVLRGDYYCYPVLIKNIQLNEEDLHEITVGDKTEVGLLLDKPARKCAEIFLEAAG